MNTAGLGFAGGEEGKSIKLHQKRVKMPQNHIKYKSHMKAGDIAPYDAPIHLCRIFRLKKIWRDM